MKKLRYDPRIGAHGLGKWVERTLKEMGVKPGEPFSIVSDAELHERIERPVPAGARRTDPSTSKKAALEAAPRAGKQRDRALRAVVDAGTDGATYSEVMLKSGVPSVWKRLSELHEGGWIEDSGRTRKVPETDSEATVWVATSKAYLLYHEAEPEAEEPSSAPAAEKESLF